MRFDFYLLHPSIVVNGNQIEFVQFVRNVLVQDPEAMILLEDPNDFPEEWPLAEHYREFVRCVDVYALTNPRCFGKIIGESVFSSARRYLQHGKSVCLMAFPYPELRSLCRVLQGSGQSGQNMVAVFFDEDEEISTIDLVKCDGKLGFFDIKNVSLEYKPLEDVETLKNRADFPQLEPCTKRSTRAGALQPIGCFRTCFRPIIAAMQGNSFGGIAAGPDGICSGQMEIFRLVCWMIRLEMKNDSTR